MLGRVTVRNVRLTRLQLTGEAALGNHFRDLDRERERESRPEPSAQAPPQTDSNGGTATEGRREPEPRAGSGARSGTAQSGTARGTGRSSRGRAGRTADQPAVGYRTQEETPEARAARLSHNAQSRLRSALADARRAEGAGDYASAITMYQVAYNIDPQPWISRKVDELQGSRRRQAEEEQERMQETSDAIANAAIAVGTALAPVVDEMSEGYARGFRPADNRRVEFEPIRFGIGGVTNEYTRVNGSGEPGRTTTFETAEFNVSSGLAVNVWLPYRGSGGRSLLGFRGLGRVGVAMPFPYTGEVAVSEEVTEQFEDEYLSYAYGGGVILNEMVAVGYENRSISTLDGEFNVAPLDRRTRHYAFVEVAPSFNRSLPLTLRVASALTGGCEPANGPGTVCFDQSGQSHVLVEARLPLMIAGAFGLTYERFQRSPRVTRSVLSLTISSFLR